MMKVSQTAALALTVTLNGACGSRSPAIHPIPSGGASTLATTTAADPAKDAGDAVSVTLGNPLAVPRTNETIALAVAELGKAVPRLDVRNIVIVDPSGTPVLSQLVDLDGDESPDEIVFQTDLGANESKTFKVRVGQRHPASRTDFKVYGRFVRERHDDFAWENDVVAHRVYGPELETTKKKPLTSSGVDTWSKRVSRLVVNDWYMTDNYHEDHGEGADFYTVGESRGCGGLGIWAGGKLRVSKNFVHSRVLANGPIRLVFELDYAPWQADGSRVAETKRVILDAGTRFNRFESRFSGQEGVLPVGLGIAKHTGSVVQADARSGWMRTWEPLDGGKSGHLGCAIVLPPTSSAEEQHGESDYLLVTPAPPSAALVYYVGSAWDRAGQILDAAAWTKEIQSLSSGLAAPVQVNVTVGSTR
jgi:unsaturated rhamnogalacturonyl hydrolase